ncbi:MAG: hypothetical protein V5A43_01200, partial [Haloarculaceae archaeon]
MKRNSRLQDRRHRTGSRRGRKEGVHPEESRRKPEKIQAVQRAAGNQKVQSHDAEGTQKKGTWWGGRGYEDPSKEERERGVSEAEVEATVVRWLREEGLSPPAEDLDLADYLEVDMTISSESSIPTTSARIRVGPDGNLLPTMDTIDERRPEGGYEEGSLQTATTWIEFEFHRIPDGGLYIQSAKLETKERPTGTVISMSKAADVDMSIRGRPDYSLSGDERLPGTLSDLIESAGIELGEAAPMFVPESQRSEPGSGPESKVPGATGIVPAVGTTVDSPGSAFESGIGGISGIGLGLGSLASATGDTYDVEEGDTLWDIADEVYGDPRKWPVIFEANKKTEENPDGIEDPDLIHEDREL